MEYEDILNKNSLTVLLQWGVWSQDGRDKDFESVPEKIQRITSGTDSCCLIR